jgi:hypothetical protein
MPTVMNGVSLNALTTVDTWSALSLFANGEQGAWYDPSDMSTMFQDAAGTIPVTAVEQPVGLILDKSKNLKSVFVGGLPFVSPWFGYNGGTIAGNTVTNSAGDQGAGIQTFAGRTYRITANVASISGTFYYVAEGVGTNYGTVVSGQQSFLFRATSGNLVIYGISAGSVTYNSLRIEEIPGNHASQSTAASRPVLSARVNLLTYTEQFNNAAWPLTNILAFGSGSVANTTATLDPIGGNTADLITPNTTFATHAINQAAVTSTTGTSFTQSIYVKPNGYTKIALVENQITGYYVSYNLTGSGTVLDQSNATGTVTALSNGWYRITHVSAAGGASYRFQLFILSPSYTTGSYISSWTPDGTSGIYIWGADLRVANDGVGIPAYQRVGAAVTGTSGTISPPVAAVTGVPDYDTNGFPLYLRFDGVDDSLATASIDFSAGDKMSVFAGVRKLSDAASGTFVELSVIATSNSGTFYLFMPSTGGAPTMQFGSRGTSTAAVTYNNAAIAAPVSIVFTTLSDIAGDSVLLRSNSSQVGTSAADQGTGNYGNYPLYIGRRSNASLPLNGRLYSLIVRGALSNSTQIENAENYINSKTKAY